MARWVSAALTLGLILALPLLMLLYLRALPAARETVPAHLFHSIAVLFATVWGGVLAWMAGRAWARGRHAFAFLLMLAFAGETLLYALHGLLVPWSAEYPYLFALYGPASRLVMAAFLLPALLVYGRDNWRMARPRWLFWSALLLGVAGLVAVLGVSPDTAGSGTRLVLEAAALALFLLCLLVVLWRRAQVPVGLALALVLFAQACLVFLNLGQSWDHLFWYAHLLFAVGFLLLGNMVLGLGGADRPVADLLGHERLSTQLQRYGERLSTLLESVTDGFFALDTDWRFAYVNAAAERFLRVRREDLLGQNVWDVFAPAVGTAFEENYLRAVTERRMVPFEAWFEPLQSWFEVRAFPSDEGLAVYFRDITEHRQEQEQLRLLQTSVSRLNDMVVITEADPLAEPGPRIVYVNQAFTRGTGYSAAQVLGRSPRLLQGPETSRETLQRISRALARQRPVRTELVNYNAEGKPYWVELSISPVFDDQQRCTHFVAVERDITERREDERRRQEQEIVLQRTEKLASLGQLAAGVAHEINNPMGYLKSNLGTLERYCDRLLEKTPAESGLESIRADLPALLADCREGVGRVEEIVNGLRGFAHSGEQPWEEADLNKALDTAVRLAWNELKYHVNLVRDYGELPLIRCRAVQLTQVAVNLLVNAAQAMDGEGRIVLRTTVLDAHWVRLQVVDNGVGMDEATQARLFEPFFTTKPVGQGTGLGLSVCHRIVEDHGGHIRVHSRPGEGTRFVVDLPVDGHGNAWPWHGETARPELG